MARHRHDPHETTKAPAWTAEDYNTHGPGNVAEVVTHVHQVRKEGMGVISMKTRGRGYV